MRGNQGGRDSRRALIREILESETVGSQQELLDALAKREVRVNQSSVSRDLQEMRVVKVHGRYMLGEPFEPDADDDLREMAGSVRHFRPAGSNLLVVHTRPGQASGIGLAIDRSTWPEVLGTVAGDDTLFIATAGRREQLALEARLSQLTA